MNKYNIFTYRKPLFVNVFVCTENVQQNDYSKYSAVYEKFERSL